MGKVFKTEGPLLEKDSHLYIERAEDRRIVANIRRGNYVALLGARQMGKTSLLLKLRRQLVGEGHLPIYLDASPVADRDEGAWYAHFRDGIARELKENGADASVPDMRDHLGFREGMRNLSLHLPTSQQAIILLDETGSLPPSVSDGFFSTVHAVFNERETVPAFRRYLFIMAGTFIPKELTRDLSIKSFGIATCVYSSDIDFEGLALLARNLERAGWTVPDEVIARIYDWTGGHVYLTQRLFSLLEQGRRTPLTRRLVDQAVSEVLDDRNIRSICYELSASLDEEQMLQRILAGKKRVRFNRASRVVARLELMGLIKVDADGYCTVRNAIYRKALAGGVVCEPQRKP